MATSKQTVNAKPTHRMNPGSLRPGRMLQTARRTQRGTNHLCRDRCWCTRAAATGMSSAANGRPWRSSFMTRWRRICPYCVAGASLGRWSGCALSITEKKSVRDPAASSSENTTQVPPRLPRVYLIGPWLPRRGRVLPLIVMSANFPLGGISGRSDPAQLWDLAHGLRRVSGYPGRRTISNTQVWNGSAESDRVRKGVVPSGESPVAGAKVDDLRRNGRSVFAG